MLYLFAILFFVEIFFDFFFSRTGKKIYSTIQGRNIDEDEYERKRFFLRIIGFIFWVSIYAAIYFIFDLSGK